MAGITSGMEYPNPIQRSDTTTAMIKAKADSLRELLSYYEKNISLSADSDSLSFLANIARAQRRRISLDGMSSLQPLSEKRGNEPNMNGQQMRRRASSCSTTQSSLAPNLPRRSVPSDLRPTRSLSGGTVRKTKEMFESLGASTRTSLTTTGAAMFDKEGLQIKPQHFQKLLQFWTSLPKPSPTCVAPRYPSRWKSMTPYPATLRDIALKAAIPGCLCRDEENPIESDYCSSAGTSSVCSSCGYDADWDMDDASVKSSTVCIYDGANLYLPLPQGCMVFRAMTSAPGASNDHMPQRPSRNRSHHVTRQDSSTQLSCSQSVATLSSFASVSTIAQPRTVRFSEHNEVWFFEVDDISSVFSEDGLQLSQDFASMFDSGKDQGPRQVTRRGSKSTEDPSWEYVGFYDAVKLPQDFGSAFKDAKGDSVPRRHVRRNSSDLVASLLDNVHKDLAPQKASRRGSFELEDFSFEEDSENDQYYESSIHYHDDIVHFPIAPVESCAKSMEKASCSSLSDGVPKDDSHVIQGCESCEDSCTTNLRSSNMSRRRVAPRLCVGKRSDLPSNPCLQGTGDNSLFCSEVDAVVEKISISDSDESEKEPSNNIFATRKARLSRPRTFRTLKPMNNHTSMKTTESKWNKGLDGLWKKDGKADRRSSTGNCLRPTTVRGHSFDQDGGDASIMAQVCREIKSELRRGGEAGTDEHLNTSKSRPEKPRKQRGFSLDQSSLRPGLFRGYSFSDIEIDEYECLFGDEVLHNSAPLLSTVF